MSFVVWAHGFGAATVGVKPSWVCNVTPVKYLTVNTNVSFTNTEPLVLFREMYG
jgi:hypothetical protein